MSAQTSAFQRYRALLQKDDLGVTLWGYLCAVLFLIAITISMLGCAGAPFAPHLDSSMLGNASSSASSPAAGEAISGAMTPSPLASFTVRF